MAYLDKAHLPYDLTTDLGLIDGTGPQLAGHAGVVFAGSEKWLPRSLRVALQGYVASGGHALSLGIGSTPRGVTIVGSVATRPTAPASVDALGARPDPPSGSRATPRSRSSATTWGSSGSPGAAVLSGYSSYQPTLPGPAPPALLDRVGRGRQRDLAGASSATSWCGLIDIGLPGFGSSLAHNAGARELVKRVWTVLGGVTAGSAVPFAADDGYSVVVDRRRRLSDRHVVSRFIAVLAIR